MPPASHNVKCLGCERAVGEVVRGRFVHHACGAALQRSGRTARCCHCGGSLYLEEILEQVWDAPPDLKLPHRVGGAVA